MYSARQLYESIVPYETRLWFYKLRHHRDYRKLRTTVFPSEKGSFSLKPYDEHQCIFIHITKTAGTSVAKALFSYLPYHYSAIDYRVIFGRKDFERYFKFAFVRNPWDRVYSAFRYLKSGGWNEEDKIWGEDNLSKFEDFDQFVKQWLTPENIKSHIHFHPQHQFICDKNGSLLIDYIAYFETLEEDFKQIADRLKIDSSIAHHNANPASSYLNIYNDETKKIVASVYDKDIEIFGYDFDNIRHRKIISD